MILTKFFILFSLINAYSFEIKDFRNKNILLSETPQKAAALIPNIAETIFDMGRGASIIAVPDYTSIPEEFRKKIKILGPYNQLSVETIVSLKPDVILASIDGNDSALIEKLESLKMKIIVFDTSSLDAIQKTILLLNKVYQQKPSGKTEAFLTKLNELSHSPVKKQKKIFIQIGWDPIVSVSAKTFIGELVERLGFENITAKSIIKYPKTNAEVVLSQNPDHIVICKLTDSDSDVLKTIEFWKQFKKLKAVQNNHIHVIKGDILLKPGISLLDGIKELERIRNL